MFDFISGITFVCLLLSDRIAFAAVCAAFNSPSLEASFVYAYTLCNPLKTRIPIPKSLPVKLFSNRELCSVILFVNLSSTNTSEKSPPVSKAACNTSSMTDFLSIFYLLILNLHLLYTIFMSTLPFLRLIFYRLRNENFCLADQQSQIHKSITGCEIRTLITA